MQKKSVCGFAMTVETRSCRSLFSFPSWYPLLAIRVSPLIPCDRYGPSTWLLSPTSGLKSTQPKLGWITKMSSFTCLLIPFRRLMIGHPNTIKAAYQKSRSEQQSTSQASGKRSQIDFTSSSASAASASKLRSAPKPKAAREQGAKGKEEVRFNPYTSYTDAAGVGAGRRGKERGRWGA